MQEQDWLNKAYEETVARLQQLIQIPSFSKEENDAANLFEQWMQQDGIASKRTFNNVWAKNLHFDPAKPTILLNSHIDTVKPNNGYTVNPFEAFTQNGQDHLA
jgi:acetylornithine deacetylase